MPVEGRRLGVSGITILVLLLSLGHFIFEFVSYFVLRISDLFRPPALLWVSVRSEHLAKPC